jgi:hypothetical protein
MGETENRGIQDLCFVKDRLQVSKKGLIEFIKNFGWRQDVSELEMDYTAAKEFINLDYINALQKIIDIYNDIEDFKMSTLLESLKDINVWRVELINEAWEFAKRRNDSLRQTRRKRPGVVVPDASTPDVKRSKLEESTETISLMMDAQKNDLIYVQHKVAVEIWGILSVLRYLENS